MQRFTVFSRVDGEIQVVKQGWSWPGFFFNVFWALRHRMWLLGFGVWLGSILAGAFFETVFGAMYQAGVDVLFLVVFVGLAQGVGMPVAFGHFGNRWKQANLTARGFDERGTLTAASAKIAKATFLKSGQASRAEHGDPTC